MKTNPIYLILFLILIWILNYLSSYIYMKKVNNQISKLKKKYKMTESFLGAVVGKVNIIRKVIIIIVADRYGNVLECSYLYGFTNLSDFKYKKDIVGKNTKENNEIKDDKFYNALKSCYEIINKQIETYNKKQPHENHVVVGKDNT